MLKDYVLGSEVAEKGNFSIANISMLLKNNELVEGVDYLKYGGITLLNKKSPNMPQYIRKIMLSEGMTDLSEYIPYLHFTNIVENNINLLKNKIDKVKIGGKQFVKVKDEKLKKVLTQDSIIKSVVANEEIPDLIKDKLISGNIKLSSKKSLCWY